MRVVETAPSPVARGREAPGHAGARQHPALALQRGVGNRATARLLARRPPGLNSGETYSHVAGEIFAPSVTAEGAFTGKDLLDEEAWTMRLLGAGSTEADARVDMLEPRIVVAERNRQEGAAVGTNRLGVFVAPEWYFKRAPVPYTEEEYARIIARLKKLSSAHPKLVIAPGTVLWRRKRGKRYEMANTAPVLYRGQLVTEIHKAKVNGDLDGYPEQAERQKEWDAFQGHSPSISFFEIDNVRFSLEICGDAAARRAEAEHQRLDPFGGGGRADVDLLISHGASKPLLNSTMVGEGGIAFHADSTEMAAGSKTFGTSAAYTVQRNNPKSMMPRPFFAQADVHLGDKADPERLHAGVYALPARV
jgi:hypothetical protein